MQGFFIGVEYTWVLFWGIYVGKSSKLHKGANIWF